MQFGRSYEEFEVGATYKHWPGKTVTEFDDHMFCLLTMNHHPLHMDTNYAEETTQFGKNVVVGNYVYSILLGMSVPDISGKAIANLEIESLRHVAPTFHKRHLAQLGLADDAKVDLERARRDTNLALRPRLVARAFIGPESFAVDAHGSFVVVQGYSWLPKQPVLDAPFETTELLLDYAFLMNSRLFFALLRENGRIVGGGQVDGAKNQVRRVPLPDLGAMYLETPELFEQARALRELDRSEQPSAQLLDAFTAAAYRTSLDEWSLP